MTLPQVFADPVERGCGFRTPGGVYAECGQSLRGQPFETFLIDPPLPVPPGLDLVNKPALWCDESTGITHLLIWVGAEFYPYVPDFIEEAIAHGVSRKVTPFLDFAQLTEASRMILAHPRARNTSWQGQTPPHACRKHIAGHSWASDSQELVTGPCLFKTYDLIPQAAALDPHGGSILDGRSWLTRQIGSTAYHFCPTGEAAQGLDEGIFAALPITGIALVRRSDGTVQEKAEATLRRSRLPFYHADR